MGALTLKSFPFVLRSWNVRNYDSIDPTDSFGQSTKVYVNKNQIVKIEPQFSNNSSHVWLTDKGRQFFDSLFGTGFKKSTKLDTFPVKTNTQWELLFKNITKTFYTFDICNFKNVNKQFFIIVFENVSVENLNLLFLISQINSFIKIKRAENVKFNNDLETNFQVDSATCASKLSSSSLCVLIGTNTRYEGSYLNLKLRQRYFKGNFKFFSVGSLTDLTFPVSFLGSNVTSFKTFIEGNQTFCKDMVNSSNPIFITNSESSKRMNFHEVLTYTNVLTKVWNGYNVLNSSLYETGISHVGSFSFLTLKDLISFSSLYVINVNLNNVANLKKVIESRLLNYKSFKQAFNEKLFMNQNFNVLSTNFLKFLKFKKYFYLPNSTFFETQETLINTEGLIKQATKLITRKKAKNDWQLLRKIVKSSQLNLVLGTSKNNKIIFYNESNLFNFKNFINFQFCATQTLTNLNFYLNTKNRKFIIYKKFSRFKVVSLKFVDAKLKYWLDDFYLSGKDVICSNSVTLTRCSINYKLQVTNFF